MTRKCSANLSCDGHEQQDYKILITYY